MVVVSWVPGIFFFSKIPVHIPNIVPIIYSGNAGKALRFEIEGLLLTVTKSVTQNALILSTMYSQLVLTTSGDEIHCPNMAVKEYFWMQVLVDGLIHSS